MSTGYGRRGRGTALLQALNAPTRCPVQGDDEGATSKDSVLVSSGRGGSLASLLVMDIIRETNVSRLGRICRSPPLKISK